MQKNFDETESNPSGQKTFSIFEKNQALKILVDYSLVTGKKWQAILSEIFRVTGTQTTDHAPLLTRQDLEQWARRKNNIGDAKFQIIFNFLTHPETLARPEFSKASNLEKHGATKRTGHAFEQFFDNHKNLYYLTLPERKEIRISEYMDKFEGYYSGTDPRGRWYLAVTRYPHTNFFVCHFFRYQRRRFRKRDDWALERYSGFLTIGYAIRLHMKHVISTEIEELIVTPIFESSLKRIDRLKLVYNSRLAEKFDAFLSENGEQERYEILKRIPINSYRSDFDRIKDNKIEEFVDNFRWNVLL